MIRPLIGFLLFFSVSDIFSADASAYSKQELLQEQRSLEYTAWEWRNIVGLLMDMDFQRPEKDIAYMKKLPLYQNVLLRSFLHRWRKTQHARADYINQLTGSEAEHNPVALKKLFREMLESYSTKGTVSAVFLSDLADQVAVHQNIYDENEMDDLIAFFPKIKSNMLKNSFFYILLSNGFFQRKELPPQYSNHLNSMLFHMTNKLRERLMLPPLSPGDLLNSD